VSLGKIIRSYLKNKLKAKGLREDSSSGGQAEGHEINPQYHQNTCGFIGTSSRDFDSVV
jgi:hypothetical protein